MKFEDTFFSPFSSVYLFVCLLFLFCFLAELVILGKTNGVFNILSLSDDSIV